MTHHENLRALNYKVTCFKTNKYFIDLRVRETETEKEP